MNANIKTKKVVAQSISAAIGIAATMTAFGLTLVHPQPTHSVDDAHQKFIVVTVIPKNPPSVQATVTETNKPHQLQTPRATPQVRAARTVIVQP